MTTILKASHQSSAIASTISQSQILVQSVKGFTTEKCFKHLHERNCEHHANIRGLINHRYNQLLKERGYKEEIPGGEDFERLGMDKTTVIVRPDLYFQAYRKVLTFFNDQTLFSIQLSTADFFDILHQENVKHQTNLRGKINQKYNQLLKAFDYKEMMIPGDNDLEILGLDQSTVIVHPELYFKAYEDIVGVFDTNKEVYHLQTVNGQKVDVEVKVTPGNLRASGKIYSVYALNDTNQVKEGQKVARMTTFFNWKTYGQEKIGPEYKWLEIERLDNYTNDDGVEKIKGLGTLLIKKAMAQSFHDGCPEGVKFEATGSSHFFYYSLGCRPDPYWNLRFEGLYGRVIYQKQGQDLNSKEQAFYNEKKAYIMERDSKSVEEVTLQDICFYDISKEMEKEYKKAQTERKHAEFFGGSLRMFVPPEMFKAFKV